MATTNMSFRVDEDLKKEADQLFKDLGMNTSVALNMFLTQCVSEQGIPYTPRKVPSKELQEALDELEKVERGEIKLKEYDDVHEMIEDLLDED